jgi:Anthrone oxygenase
MISGLLALVFASAFAGAALYLVLVEQPARLALDDASMIREWAPSDSRGFALLGGLAVLAALAGLAAFAQNSDVRWLIGALVVVASWPYTFFVIVPLNNRLLASSAGRPDADAREIITFWGQLEWGLFALGLVATGVFAWALP